MIEVNSAFSLDEMIVEVRNYDIQHHRMSNVMAGSILRILEYLKCKSEEPPLGEPPDYISLSFHQLANMIGDPVYVKSSGFKGQWQIVMAVRRTNDGDDVCFKGDKTWTRIGKGIYRTKEGSEQ